MIPHSISVKLIWESCGVWLASLTSCHKWCTGHNHLRAKPSGYPAISDCPQGPAYRPILLWFLLLCHCFPSPSSVSFQSLDTLPWGIMVECGASEIMVWKPVWLHAQKRADYDSYVTLYYLTVYLYYEYFLFNLWLFVSVMVTDGKDEELTIISSLIISICICPNQCCILLPSIAIVQLRKSENITTFSLYRCLYPSKGYVTHALIEKI